MDIKIIHRKLSVDEYHKMVEAGILHEDDRVELINGQIVEMSPIGSRHIACVNKTTSVLTRLLGDTVIVSVQNPVRISDFSEPEPDFSLLKYREDFYANNTPEPEDILWLIEVADSSWEYDTEIKLPLYAQAGMREVWIIDLNRNEIRVHQKPVDDIYSLRSIYRPGEQVILPSQQISLEVDQLLL